MSEYKLVGEDERQAMGFAASAWLRENDPAGLDWCDGRNVDQLLEAMLAAAPDHVAEARKKVSRPQIREAFLRNGASIPADRDDLPDWAYESAFELLHSAIQQAKPAIQYVAPDAPLRYTNDGALAECPCCGSLDVGGAHDTVHCQSCGLTVTKPRPLQNAIDTWNTRTGRMHPAPAVQGEPVTVVSEETYSSDGTSDIITRTLPIGTKLYTSPQPAALPANLKDIVTSFFYWWHNQPGTNTAEGYDEWASNPSIQRMIAGAQPAEQQPKAGTIGHISRGKASLSVAAARIVSGQPARQRCEYCDGTGDVHSIDGEWRGTCSCPACQPSPADSSLPYVPDELFTAEFYAWWEQHGQLCRSGGGDYERTFAFEAWRHLYPQLMNLQMVAAEQRPAPALCMGCVEQSSRIRELEHKMDAHKSQSPAPDIEAAAKKMAEVFDYPWEHMPEQGRENMRKNAIAVLAEARRQGGEQ